MAGKEFTSADEGAIREFERAMREEGWAEFVTLSRELDGWASLAREVNEYRYTIDDYTNDLYARNYLERALNDLPTSFSEALRGQVHEVDDRFREATEPDHSRRLGHYHRIDESSGWWWRRIPRDGPLAQYLHENG